MEDANHNYDTLWFGFALTGTCGVDTQLCELNLVEPCGPPTELFCAYWYIGDECAPENNGTLVRYNYVAYHNQTQIDTFKLIYQPGPPEPRYPVKIDWSRELVSALYDTTVIKDYFGVILAHMDQQDFLIITESSLNWVFIIGQNPILTSVPSNQEITVTQVRGDLT